MDPKRILAPLDAEREAIRSLSEYGTAEELGDAVRRVSAAIDRVLRLLLRDARAVPDGTRMAALSDGLPSGEVVSALRRADTITMELAAGVEQLRGAAERASAGAAVAADADLAEDVLHRLVDAMAALGAPVTPATAPPAVPPRESRRGGRALLIAAVVAACGGPFAWLAMRDRAPGARAGVDAFAAGRLAEAEAVFRSRVDRRGAVTDWLYLGRIYRRMGRMEDAAAALRTAADAGPRDAAVRRELGWLFMDLGRPASAVGQFQLALEFAPDEPLTWVALVRALRAADDPAAEEWYERAPREAQIQLDPARRRVRD